jgi:hypothetical protein
MIRDPHRTSDILDSALLRPGRIDRKIEFPPPGPEARVSILRIHSRKVVFLVSCNILVIILIFRCPCNEVSIFVLSLKRWVNVPVLRSGVFARKLVRLYMFVFEAINGCPGTGMYALRERRQHVTQEDFEFAVAKVRRRYHILSFSDMIVCQQHIGAQEEPRGEYFRQQAILLNCLGPRCITYLIISFCGSPSSFCLVHLIKPMSLYSRYFALIVLAIQVIQTLTEIGNRSRNAVPAYLVSATRQSNQVVYPPSPGSCTLLHKYRWRQ